jgi:hypothetical protein
MIADRARAEMLVRLSSTTAELPLDVVCFDEVGQLDDACALHHALPSPRIAAHE